MNVPTRRVFVLFLTCVFLLGVYVYRVKITKIFSYSECDTPIFYRLGTLDPKFNLDQTRAMEDIGIARDIWNNGYSTPLFFANPTATLSINFVYDERTALRMQISTLRNQLDQNSVALQQQIDSYLTDVSVLEKKLDTFKARVAEVNKAGGASGDEYTNLIAEQTALKKEADALNDRASKLKLGTRSYNTSVDNLNDNVSLFNDDLTKKPEEGLYNETDSTITIYFADNRNELVHTIAHEFGHVLGALHTDDKKDMMYPYVSSTGSLTTKDKEQLDYICREQLLPIRWFRLAANFLVN